MSLINQNISSSTGTAGSDPSQSRVSTDINKLKNACKQFEALFVAQMLKVMRESGAEITGEQSMGMGGPFQGMFDWELAQKLSRQSPLGISKNLLQKYGIDEAEIKELNKSIDLENIKMRRIGGSQKTADDIDGLIARAAGEYRLDPKLIHAVITCESSFDPNTVSNKGAKGLMQLMDETAGELGVDDPFDPEQNIFGGAAYLRQMLDRYNGDAELALAAYNAGPSAVDKHNGIPPYKETENYVQRVLTNYKNQTEHKQD